MGKDGGPRKVVVRMPRPRRVTLTAGLAGCLFATALAGVAGVAHAFDPRAAADSPATAPSAPATAPVTDVRAVRHHLAVRPLAHLTAPDAVVVLRHPAPPGQVDRLRHASEIWTATVLDRGVVHVDGHRLLAAGVDPGGVRGFTP